MLYEVITLDRRPAPGPALVLVPERERVGLAALSLEPDAAPGGACLLRVVLDEESVITSYSIHYTKLYEMIRT